MLDAMVESSQPVLQLRGSLFTLSVVQLQELDLKKIDKELKSLVRQAPKFFEHAPIVIDLQHLTDNTVNIDFPELTQCLREHGLIPVGVRGGTTQHHQAAKAFGLAILSLSKSEEPQLATKQKNTSTTPKSKKADQPVAKVNKLVARPVRSGQQVYAKGGDLVVLGPVSHGSELLADGNIHVYGPLRGRALAGISGDTEARIFCQSMEAELVSIAGRYIVNESLINTEKNQAQQIYLQDGKLEIVPL